MDEKTRERVHAIAKSLKELHLATNMEEALKRAKEIVESANSGGDPINKLVDSDVKDHEKVIKKLRAASDKARQELSSQARAEHSDVDKTLEKGKEAKQDTNKTKQELKEDIKVHKLEKGDVDEATREVDGIDCAVKDAKYIVEEAEKIQKKKKD